MGAPAHVLLELTAREFRAIHELFDRAIHRPVHDLEELEIILSKLDDAITLQTQALADNTKAINDLIAAEAATEPTQAQLDALAANTKTATDNTAAIDAVLNPPAPVVEPAPETAPEPQPES